MTQFHSDDYIEFLSKITPSNMGNFVKEQHKCQLHSFFLYLETDVAQATLVTTARCSTGYSIIVQSPPEGPWVSLVTQISLAHSHTCTEGAARLSRDKCDIAVNWAGGLHHAKKGEASGFCYVNGTSPQLHLFEQL